MDFIITQRKIRDTYISSRYDNLCTYDKFYVYFASSKNIRTVYINDQLQILISGIVYGNLNNLYDNLHDKKIINEIHKVDGSFAIVVLKDKSINIITDAGGSTPVFYSYGPLDLCIGTLAHHVARLSGNSNIDFISAADFLTNENICFPYTLYNNVYEIPPATIAKFKTSDKGFYNYWLPQEPEDIYSKADIPKWGRILYGQIKNIINTSLPTKKNTRILYSGGKDSRAILSLVPSHITCVPTTVLDFENREYRLAKKSARLLGRSLELIVRPQKYYVSSVYNRIDLIGPCWDFRHTHIYGNVAQQIDNCDIIFGGYLADSLFKTPYMHNIEYRQRRAAKLLSPHPDAVCKPDFMDGSLAFVAPWNELAAKAQKRRYEHHEKIKEFRPLTAGNWHSLWPLSNIITYAHYMTCRRMHSEIVEPFLFHKSYMLAAQMPDTARIDQKAFRQAFSKEMRIAGFVPTSSGDIPYFGGNSGSIIQYYIKYWREIKRKVGFQRGNQFAWSPEHLKWKLLNIDDHLTEEQKEKFYKRLHEIFVDDQINSLFRNNVYSKQVSNMQMLSLILAIN